MMDATTFIPIKDEKACVAWDYPPLHCLVPAKSSLAKSSTLPQLVSIVVSVVVTVLVIIGIAIFVCVKKKGSRRKWKKKLNPTNVTRFQTQQISINIK